MQMATRTVQNFNKLHIWNTWITITYWYHLGRKRLSPSAPQSEKNFIMPCFGRALFISFSPGRQLYPITLTLGKPKTLSRFILPRNDSICSSDFHSFFDAKNSLGPDYCSLLPLCKEKPDTLAGMAGNHLLSILSGESCRMTCHGPPVRRCIIQEMKFCIMRQPG